MRSFPYIYWLLLHLKFNLLCLVYFHVVGCLFVLLFSSMAQCGRLQVRGLKVSEDDPANHPHGQAPHSQAPSPPAIEAVSTMDVFAVPVGCGRYLSDYRASTRKWPNIELICKQEIGPNDGFISAIVKSHNGCGIAPGSEVVADLGARYIQWTQHGQAPEAKRFKGALDNWLDRHLKASEAQAEAGTAGGGPPSGGSGGGGEGGRGAGVAPSVGSGGGSGANGDAPGGASGAQNGAPSGASGAPSGASGAPSGASGAPSATSGAPTGASGAPSAASGAPSGASGAPSGGAPSGASGAPSGGAGPGASPGGSAGQAVAGEQLAARDGWIVSLKGGDLMLQQAAGVKINRKVAPKTVLHTFVGGNVGEVQAPTAHTFAFTFSKPTEQVVKPDRTLCTLSQMVKDQRLEQLYMHQKFPKGVAPTTFTSKATTRAYQPTAEQAKFFSAAVRVTADEKSPIQLLWKLKVVGEKAIPDGVCLVVKKQIILKSDVPFNLAG